MVKVLTCKDCSGTGEIHLQSWDDTPGDRGIIYLKKTCETCGGTGKVETGGLPEEIRFYKATGEYGFLSNLYRCRVEYLDIAFPSSENAYQYNKPNKQEIRDIIKTCLPRIAAIIGHGLFIYDIVPEWSRLKVGFMRDVLRAKFTQNPDLKSMLLQTGDSILIENSKTDAFWGLGKKGNGKNMLGTLLMELRSSLKDGTIR